MADSDQLSWDFFGGAQLPPKPEPAQLPEQQPQPPPEWTEEFAASLPPKPEGSMWYDDDDEEIPADFVVEGLVGQEVEKEAPLDFEKPMPDGAQDGLNSWRQAREEHLRALASKRGLPLGHVVELTMKHGPVLRGKLVLSEEMLFVEITRVEQMTFRIDGVLIKTGDIESCVRLD